MALSTYAELQASIASWINRDDLTDQLPDFIKLAEARLNRKLLTPEREETLTDTTDSGEIALPADFYGLREIYLDTDPKTVLQPLALGELRGTHAAATTGLPVHYAIVGGDTLVLSPAPDAEYTLKLTYWADIPPLSDDNPTNWLLTAYPDLYLACSLVEASLFIMDEARAQLWDGRASRQIDEIMRAGRRKSQGAAPRRLRSYYQV